MENILCLTIDDFYEDITPCLPGTYIFSSQSQDGFDPQAPLRLNAKFHTAKIRLFFPSMVIFMDSSMDSSLEITRIKRIIKREVDGKTTSYTFECAHTCKQTETIHVLVNA